MKSKTNIEIYKVAAKNLGLKSELVQSSPTKKVLLISNSKKFFLASAAAPGFYPETSRWNAHFSGSKLLTQKMLKRFGYKVITSKEIRIADFSSSKELCASLEKGRYSFPLLIKPDKGLMGQGIAIIENISQLKKQAIVNFKNESDFMLQPILNQAEYRIFVLNGEVILMHSKCNPYVTGDGKSTISQLLQEIPSGKKDTAFIAWQHSVHNTKSTTVLSKNSKFEYHLTKKPNTDYYETTDIPQAVKKWALRLAKDVSSPVVGIDVFIKGSVTDTSSYTIIELNNNPGVNYLITFCNDDKTPYRIFEKVLKDYFKI